MENPVKDTGVKSMKSAINRRNLSKMEREELEDRYVTLFDENIVLKKYGKKRDEEIKKLCTIQSRLEKDRKKLLADTGVKSGSFYEEKMNLQNDKIHSLEKHVEQLKIKLKLQKEHTSIAQLANKPTYAHVNSKVDTGVLKQQINPQLIKNIKMIIQPNKSSSAKLKVLPHMEKEMVDGGTETSPVIDTREFEHQQEIENLIERHNIKLREYEMMINTLQKKMLENEKAHENAINHLKLRVMEEENKAVFRQPSVELHSGRNEEKFNHLLDQFQNLEQKTLVLRRNNESAAMEIESLNGLLKQEQQRYLELKNQLQVENNKSYRIEELETQLNVARRECELLKESNDNLLHKSFEFRAQSVPLNRTDIESQKRETSLRIQLAQMEAAMKIELESKDDLLDRLTKEKRNRIELQEECQELRKKTDGLVVEIDVLKEKAALFDDNSGVLNHSEFIEALALVKKRKSGNDEDFYTSVPSANKDEMTLEIRSLKCQLKDAINELEKARSMLVVQYRLNKDCKTEIESMSKKMENSKRETDIELDRYAQLLDIRAQRIRKLEEQLKDIAYGRGSQGKYLLEAGSAENDGEDDSDVIEDGKNLLEIHISKAQLTEEAVSLLNDASASLFITLDFYDFQTQSTPILNGPKADFNYTSQYVVVFDDVFIHYLHKDFCTVELQHNIGEDFKTIGSVLLSCREVVTQPGERLHGSIQLKGVTPTDNDVTYAVMDYWVRLKVPMEQALRQYRERCIALGYLESNLLYSEKNFIQTSAQMINNNNNLNNSIQQKGLPKRQQMIHSKNSFEQPKTSGRNGHKISSNKENLSSTSPKKGQQNSQEKHSSLDVGTNGKFPFLEVNVVRCSDLHSYRNSNVPSSYVSYKLHEFEEHATPVIAHSRNPVFDDVRSFDVRGNNGFSSYLEEDLKLSVMILSESGEPSCFGQATIPLRLLLHKSQLEDTFTIIDSSDEVVGTIEVMFSWKGEDRAAHKNESVIKPKPRGEKKKSTKHNNDMKQDSPHSSPKSVDNLKTSPLNDEQYIVDTSKEMGSEEEKQKSNAKKPILRERSSIHSSASSKGSEERETIDDKINAHDKAAEPHNPSASNTQAFLLDELENEDQNISISKTNDDTICIEITKVRLNNGSPVLQDSKVKMLYVAYQFLGESPENTETPVSMPKPSQPDIPIEFNFKKEFYVGEKGNSTKRQYLKEMINSQDPEYSSIKFTLISEPQNDDDDCEDIGVAQVDLKKIIETEKDVLDEEVLIQSELDGSVLGYMTLSVSCLQTLKTLYKKEIIEE